jgi:rod shape-determining protein MreC
MDRYDKLKRWLIMIVAILIITVMGITMGGRERVTMIENVVGSVVTPVQKVVYAVGDFIGDRIRPIISIWELEDENQALLEENERLNQELLEAQLTTEEYEDLSELKNVLNYVDDQRIDDYITCNVIGKETGNWYNMFVIDAGTDDGITKYSAVMNGNGLIGLVYDVGWNWAKVQTIIDVKSKIGFEVLGAKETYDGFLHGTEESVIRGTLLDTAAEVEVGDSVVTSGLGLLAKGIRIGYISEVVYNENELLTEIIVEPSVNFKNINRVFVVVKEELEDVQQ